MITARNLFIIISVIILINITFVSAITGSMGNAKMILYPEVNGFTTTIIEKSILTKNVNDIPINVTLQVDEAGKEFLELIDESFTLPAGEEKKAEFLVKVRKEGTYNGKINVFFSPFEGKEPGVVLSSNIIVIAKKDQNYEEIDEGSEDVEDIDDEEGVSVSFGGTPPENLDSDSESSISLKGIMFGMSFILIVVLGGLIHLMVTRLNGKNKKRRVKKSGGNKKVKRKKK